MDIHASRLGMQREQMPMLPSLLLSGRPGEACPIRVEKTPLTESSGAGESKYLGKTGIKSLYKHSASLALIPRAKQSTYLPHLLPPLPIYPYKPPTRHQLSHVNQPLLSNHSITSPAIMVRFVNPGQGQQLFLTCSLPVLAY